MNVKIDISNTRITTPRLLLRPWAQEDVQDLYAYASVDGVGQMAGWLPHNDIEESRTILGSFIRDRKTFAIVLKATGKVIGSLGIEAYDEEALPEFTDKQGREIGYVLAKDYWGRGLMPEAVNAVIDYLFNEMTLDFIICCHFTDNAASWRVQQKCGFAHYKLIKSETRYGIVKDSWVSVRYRSGV